jgi:hypothetical protein
MTLTTKQLIDIAHRAQAALDKALMVANKVAEVIQSLKNDVQNANQNVHDDLAANGPCIVVDNTTSPPTALMYTAVDPDSFTATPVRVAA